MQKQIEEMANDIGEKQEAGWKFLDDGYMTDVFNQEVAEHLVAKGWRKQEWIGVEERLPAEDVRVLVWLRKDHKITYTLIDTDRRLNGEWVRWYESVTHWMPLPEPPKGDTDANH